MKKKLVNFIVFTIILLMTATMLFGCGFAAANSKDDEGHHSGTDTTLLVYDETKDGAQKLTTNASGKEEIWTGILQHHVLDGNQDYKINSLTKGKNFVHGIADAMYQSIFDDRVPSYFTDKKFSGMKLDPVDVMNAGLTAAANVNASEAMQGLDAIATSIFLVVWGMTFVQQIVNDKFTIETMLKGFMQLICGILLITYATPIVNAFASIGQSNVTGSAGAYGGKLQTDCAERLGEIDMYIAGFNFLDGAFASPIGIAYFDWNAVLVVVLLIVPMVSVLKLCLNILTICILRTMELKARIAMAPIPIAFSAYQGFGHEAMQYFRATAACALQPMLMSFGLLCFDPICEAVMGVTGGKSNILGAIIGLFLSYSALSAYMGETKRMASEIIAR